MKHLLLLLIPVWVFAQPNITGISFSTGDTIQHNAVMTITGTGFGSKSPAPPLIWDNCENRTVGINNEYFNAGWTEAAPYAPATDSMEMIYRDTTFRNVGAPHLHSRKVVGGSHEEDALGCVGGKMGRNVMLTKNFGGAQVKTVFAMWYKRLDPLWQDPQPGADYNYKDWVINNGLTGYSSGTGDTYCGVVGTQGPKADSTVVHRTGDHAMLWNSAGTISYGHTSAGTYPRKICDNGPISQYRSDFESFLGNTDATCGAGEMFNEAIDWTKREVLIAGNDLGLCYEKGYGTPEYSQRGSYTWYQDSLPNFQWGSASAPTYSTYGSFTVGGYHRIALCATGYTLRDDDRQWFDDMYIDTVLARIVITDNDDYDASKLCEIQIPITWSATSITATVNLGVLDGTRANLDTVYCYVFDSNNVRSSGYTIVLGEATAGGGGTPAETIEVKLHKIEGN